MSASAKAKSKHKFRENVDAFAIAILMAILFKFFAIEAYQIPTSSMQPTMMGSSSASVYDRILVDKTRYMITEPERWDIAVFRYPIRTRQNYVKRIVGTPGDRLRVAGGNIYQVAPGSDGTEPANLAVERRPDRVQGGHWKEIFPARLAVQSQTKALGNALSARGGEWREEDGALIVTPRSERSAAILRYPGPNDSGLVNQVWDGYPAWVAQRMLEAQEDKAFSPETVQDARVSFSVEPRSELQELAIRLSIDPATGPRRKFELLVEQGEGRIVVTEDGKEAAATPAFPATLAAGRATDIEFAHLDDRCIAKIDGDLVAELDCSAFKLLDPIFPRGNNSGAGLRLDFKSGGEVRIEGLRIDRDLHYLPSTSSRRDGTIDIIEVPDAHYFMMGDNTLQSVDSRDWTSITLARRSDGTLVDPATHPDAERMTGNMRAISVSEMPDPDENPVVVADEHSIVFTDDVGEVYVLKGDVALDSAANKTWGSESLWFEGDDGYWEPDRAKVRFVPRGDILGRPLVTFWPLWSPFRLGFIR